MLYTQSLYNVIKHVTTAVIFEKEIYDKEHQSGIVFDSEKVDTTIRERLNKFEISIQWNVLLIKFIKNNIYHYMERYTIKC